MYNDFWFSEEL